MVLKLYYDLMSQPSRALYILLKSINCSFEPKYVDLRQAEHYSENFKKINRMQRVPVIDDNGFILTESVAILKYLQENNVIPDSLYPKDIKRQARVNEFLEWQHAGLRLHCAMYFRVHYLDPKFGKKNDEKTLLGYERRMLTALEDLETKWLGQGHNFVVGDTITVADLLAACEVEQPRMVGFEPGDKFTNIGAWLKRVRAHFPYYEEGHAIVNKIIQKQRSKL